MLIIHMSCDLDLEGGDLFFFSFFLCSSSSFLHGTTSYDDTTIPTLVTNKKDFKKINDFRFLLVPYDCNHFS